MRRYLVAQQIGGTDSPLKYLNHSIIDAFDDEDAVTRYNEAHLADSPFGTAIAFVKEDMTTKHVRSGKIDEKMLTYMFKHNTLIPIRD